MLTPRDAVEVTLPGHRWEELTASDPAFDILGSRRGQTIWSVPLRVQNTPLEEIAGGQHDDTWAELGRLVAPGGRQAVVRLTIPAGAPPETSAAAFRRASAALRRTPGVLVEWSPPQGADPAGYAPAWPGADSVDVVGVQASSNPVWAAAVAAPGGLADWTSWARNQGKRVAVHWRLDEDSDAVQVQRVADWLALSARTSTLAYDSVTASTRADSAALTSYRHLW